MLAEFLTMTIRIELAFSSQKRWARSTGNWQPGTGN